MKLRCLLAALIGLTAFDATAQLVPGEPVPTSDPNGAYCREYTQAVVIGGVRRSSYGTACRQPDGDWRIMTTDQQAPPEQIEYVGDPVYISPPRYVVPPTVYYEYESYPYPYPYYAPPAYRRGGYYGGGSSVRIDIGGGHYGHGYRNSPHNGYYGYHR